MKADRIKELVKNHYSEHDKGEWGRLVGHPYHRLEFDTTMHYL